MHDLQSGLDGTGRVMHLHTGRIAAVSSYFHPSNPPKKLFVLLNTRLHSHKWRSIVAKNFDFLTHLS